MSGYVETPTRTFINSAALASDRRVKRSSATALAYAGLMDRALGNLESDAFAITGGIPVAVRLRQAPGTRRGIAAGAFSAGAILYAAANGKLDDIGFLKEGYALSDALADGDVFEYMPCFDDEEHEASVTIAGAGSASTDAAAITHRLTEVSGADGTVGVILPTPTKAGVKVSVYNQHATNGLKIYPHSGGNINDGTTTTGAITIEGKGIATFVALSTTKWASAYVINA